MTDLENKLYPHVTGVLGDDGENPGVLAVTAVLDPSPNYPSDGRIIVGSPTRSDVLPGYLPNLGGFCMGIAGAERLIATLKQAISDVRAATGDYKTSEVWAHPPYLVGYERIGRLDAEGRRSLWLKEGHDEFELRAGREGGDGHVRVTSEHPLFRELRNAMGCARFAAEWEHKQGFALSPLGIEHFGYETSAPIVTDESMLHTTVFVFRDDARNQRFRVIVRHERHFAVQFLQPPQPDPLFPDQEAHPSWESVTMQTCDVSPDQVMTWLLVTLARHGAKAYVMPLETSVVGNVTTIDLGDLV
jgi:hypothetical protein